MSAADRHHRLHDTLRRRICLLDYPPGTVLSESALAGEFGLSRTPMRRVLARLEDEGLVETRHGIGTIVTDVDRGEMAQIYALRMELAQLSGRLDPAPAGPDDLAVLDGFADRTAALARAPEARRFAEENMAFFTFCLSLTRNAALRAAMQRLYYRTARIWLASIDRMDLVQEIAHFRDEVLETRKALDAGDLEAAALVRRAHISMSFRRLTAA